MFYYYLNGVFEFEDLRPLPPALPDPLAKKGRFTTAPLFEEFGLFCSLILSYSSLIYCYHWLNVGLLPGKGASNLLTELLVVLSAPCLLWAPLSVGPLDASLFPASKLSV